MQWDFINGALGTPEAIHILPKVKEKILQYINTNNEILYTQDTHNDNYLFTQEGQKLPVPHCIKNTKGWEIPKAIDSKAFYHIYKQTFGWTNWYGLDEFESIEIIGLCTDICVVSNALIIKALYPEISITVDASCCAGTSPKAHQAALMTMESCQIQVINNEG